MAYKKSYQEDLAGKKKSFLSVCGLPVCSLSHGSTEAVSTAPLCDHDTTTARTDKGFGLSWDQHTLTLSHTHWSSTFGPIWTKPVVTLRGSFQTTELISHNNSPPDGARAERLSDWSNEQRQKKDQCMETCVYVWVYAVEGLEYTGVKNYYVF